MIHLYDNIGYNKYCSFAYSIMFRGIRMTITNPLVSVIVPVYNGESYVHYCLDSIIQNSYQNIQLVCIDDGSNDSSLSILKKYADNDDRIIVIHQSNHGVSAARNAGLKLASGDYVAFVDSDDWIHPHYFKILVNLATEYSADIIATSYIRIQNRSSHSLSEINHVHSHLLCPEEMLSQHNIKNYVWGKLYKASLVLETHFLEDLSFGEDSLFNASIICNNPESSICYTDMQLYYYYNRPNSLVHTGSSSDLMTVGKRLLLYGKQIDSEGLKVILLKEATKRILSARYSALVLKEKEQFKKSNSLLKECYRELKYMNNKSFSILEKIIYFVLCQSPQVYRLWRIKNDPTLLIWERENKRKR